MGKGVIIVKNADEANQALKAMMVDYAFGQAGQRVVVEEYLTGSEVTVMEFTDGKNFKPMVSAQDHKRVYDNDEGSNTGGMGAFSPSRVYTPGIAKQVEENNRAYNRSYGQRGRPFQGVLYFGLMLTEKGPKCWNIMQDLEIRKPGCVTTPKRPISLIFSRRLRKKAGSNRHPMGR